MRWVGCALLGADVPVRFVLATALQLGLAAGVGAMLLLQMRVALTDDRTLHARPR